MAKERLVVIGGDAAGISALRKRARDAPIWILLSLSVVLLLPIPPEAFLTMLARLSTNRRTWLNGHRKYSGKNTTSMFEHTMRLRKSISTGAECWRDNLKRVGPRGSRSITCILPWGPLPFVLEFPAAMPRESTG